MSTTEADAKELVREFTDELNAGNYDGVEELFADGYNELYDNEETVSERIQNARDRDEAFADKHEDLDVILTDTDWDDGQRLEAWYDVTGTHEGEFINIPPTGNEVKFPLVRMLVIEDGRITRYRVAYTLGFLLDLGVDWETLTDEIDLQHYLTSPKAAGSARAE